MESKPLAQNEHVVHITGPCIIDGANSTSLALTQQLEQLLRCSRGSHINALCSLSALLCFNACDILPDCALRLDGKT